MAAIYYRIVHREIPTADDFRTMKELGQPLHKEANRREWAEGISVYSDRDFAIRRARTNNSDLGRFVVPVTIPEGSNIEIRQTTRDRRHYTIYASGERALALVCGETMRATEQDGDDY